LTPQSQPQKPPRRTSAALRRTPFELRPDERWAILGKTGTGKSQLAMFLDRRWIAAGWLVLIVDPKHRYLNLSKGETYAEGPEDASVVHPLRINGKLREDARVQIYLPTLPAKRDPVLDALFYQVIDRGSVVVHIDDLSGVADAHTIMDGLGALWTQGRAAEIPVIALIQKPLNVPRDIFSQSENIVVFRMTDARDRAEAAKILSAPELTAPIPKYVWWYRREEMDSFVKMAPLPPSEIVLPQNREAPQSPQERRAENAS